MLWEFVKGKKRVIVHAPSRAEAHEAIGEDWDCAGLVDQFDDHVVLGRMLNGKRESLPHLHSGASGLNYAVLTADRS